jgi:Flp pilus assembly protein TadD
MQFYMTFMREGKRPTPNALAALHHASDLAPQDYGVRLNSALAYLQEGKTKEARQALVAVAYSPHAEGAADAARRMIARIDAGDAQGAIRTAVTN